MSEKTEAFFGDPRVIEVGGKKIEVKPFRARHLSRAARCAEPVLRAIAESGTGAGINYLRVVQQTDEIIELCALATYSEANFAGKLEAWVDWIGDLDPADLLSMATAVIEVNADFFIRRLMPAAQEAMASVAEKVGQASSSASGAPASA